jgi:hypothetical protein
MKQYSSNLILLQASAEDVFHYLSDFRNFGRVLPSEINNWQADADSCSFDAPMLGSVSFTYAEKIPVSLIRIVPGAELPVKLAILCKLDEEHNQAMVVVEADLPMMQEMFLGRILQNMADLMAKRLESIRPEDMQTS